VKTAVLIVAGVAVIFAPLAVSAGIPVCMFKLATGRPCIFCGLTTALTHAMRGEWSAASHANALWFALVPLAILGAAAIASRKRAPAWIVVAVIVIASITRAYLL
jgi:hypothetical protein